MFYTQRNVGRSDCRKTRRILRYRLHFLRPSTVWTQDRSTKQEDNHVSRRQIFQDNGSGRPVRTNKFIRTNQIVRINKFIWANQIIRTNKFIQDNQIVWSNKFIQANQILCTNILIKANQIVQSNMFIRANQIVRTNKLIRSNQIIRKNKFHSIQSYYSEQHIHSGKSDCSDQQDRSRSIGLFITVIFFEVIKKIRQLSDCYLTVTFFEVIKKIGRLSDCYQTITFFRVSIRSSHRKIPAIARVMDPEYSLVKVNSSHDHSHCMSDGPRIPFS